MHCIYCIELNKYVISQVVVFPPDTTGTMACENDTTARRDADPFSDQYADGVAAALPQFFSRTPAYKQWLSSVVAGRSGKRVLDAACGNGYVVVSCDTC